MQRSNTFKRARKLNRVLQRLQSITRTRPMPVSLESHQAEPEWHRQIKDLLACIIFLLYFILLFYSFLTASFNIPPPPAVGKKICLKIQKPNPNTIRARIFTQQNWPHRSELSGRSQEMNDRPALKKKKKKGTSRWRRQTGQDLITYTTILQF